MYLPENVFKEYSVIRNIPKIFCLHCFFLVLGFATYAQSNEGTTEQLWVDFIPHFKVNEKLEFYGDASVRVIFEEKKIYTFIARPSVRYHLNSIVELQGGIGFFYSIIGDITNQLELRPWQGIRIHWPTFGRIGIKHSIKLEERLLWDTETWEFDPALRFRYKLGGRIPFNESRRIYLSLFGEAFASAGGESISILRNRMRGYFGFGYKRNDAWTVEIEFMLQRSRSNAIEDFSVSDRIFRLKVIKDGWVW
jgi:hypothetical protein